MRKRCKEMHGKKEKKKTTTQSGINHTPLRSAGGGRMRCSTTRGLLTRSAMGSDSGCGKSERAQKMDVSLSLSLSLSLSHTQRKPFVNLSSERQTERDRERQKEKERENIQHPNRTLIGDNIDDKAVQQQGRGVVLHARAVAVVPEHHHAGMLVMARGPQQAEAEQTQQQEGQDHPPHHL